MAGALADHVELALQRILFEVAHAAADEHLANHRLDFLGALGESAVVGGHIAPAQEHLAFGRDCPLYFLLAGHPGRRLARQEHHAHAVLADRRQRDGELAARPPQERVGQLDQDAGAVALQRIGARGTAMHEVFEDREPVADDRMGFATFDVGDEPQPARVMLVRRIVETLAGRRPICETLRMLFHGDLVRVWFRAPRTIGRRRGPTVAKSGRNRVMVLAMLHCGNNAPQPDVRRATEAAGRHPFPERKTCAGHVLGL